VIRQQLWRITLSVYRVVQNGNPRSRFCAPLQVLRRLPWVWRQLSGVVQTATYKSAVATTFIAYGEPFRAVDGQTATTFSSETCVRTLNSANVTKDDGFGIALGAGTNGSAAGDYQEVRIDLGDERDVLSMTIWPVLDADAVAAGHTKGFEITVGMSLDPRLNTACAVPADLAAAPASQTGADGSVSFDCFGTGRFVTVRRYLTLAPLQWDNTVEFCELFVSGCRSQWLHAH
jgi:hypothetical protein